MLIPRLWPGECQVWWARPLTTTRPETLADLLDPVEITRRNALHRDADRARFTVAAALLRLVAGAHLGVEPRRLVISRACPDCERPHGRPTLPAEGWECSVSHSGDRVAVAIGPTGRLGVDVEAVERHRDTDVRGLVLGPEEQAGTDDVLTYWVRKEAVLKATGEGLRVPLTDVVVSAPDAPPRLIRAHRADLPGRTSLRTLHPGDGYRACLAVLDTAGADVTEHEAADLLG